MFGQLPKLKLAGSDVEIEGFPVSIANPPKTAVIRFPTNAELIAFDAAQKTLIIDLGRGRTRMQDIPHNRATARLFNAIRIDKDGVEFDDAEMSKAIGKITMHKMLGCERIGDTEFDVRIATPFDDPGDPAEDSDRATLPIVHHVRVPYEQEAADYRQAQSVRTELPDNKTELFIPITAPAALFDKITKRADGYAPGTEIPVIHKRTVINAVMAVLQQAENSAFDPNS